MSALWFVVVFATVTALGQAPSGWEATYRRGLELMLAGKTAAAIALFERALTEAPAFEAAIEAVAQAHHHQATLLAVDGAAAAPRRRAHLEAAATQYRRLAERATSPYRQLAVMKLVQIYGDDGLAQPLDAIPYARMYVAMAPTAMASHGQLAGALKAAGRLADAAAALRAGAAQVGRYDQAPLAVAMVAFVIETAGLGRADATALLAAAGPILDRALTETPHDRTLLMSKAAALKVRADRVETDPARQRSLLTESERVYERFSSSNRERRDDPPGAAFAPLEDPPAAPPPITQAVDPPGYPPGFAAAMQEAEGLGARKEFAKAAAVYERFVKSHPAFPQAHYLRIRALVAAGQRPAIAPALEAARGAVPRTAEARHTAGVYLYDIVARDKTMAAEDAVPLLREARAALDDELTLRPGHGEALVYKALVLRQQARFEKDPAAAKALLAEADRVAAEGKAALKRQ